MMVSKSQCLNLFRLHIKEAYLNELFNLLYLQNWIPNHKYATYCAVLQLQVAALSEAHSYDKTFLEALK